MSKTLEEKLAIAKRAVEHWQAEYEKAASKIELMRFHVSKDVEKIIDELLKDKEGKMKKEGRMCYIVKKGSQEISTVKEFREAFPGVPIVQHFFIKSLAGEYCLCQVDIKATLDEADIEHTFDGSCYIVIEIDKLIMQRRTK
ncbi:MAG: hypothetical protein GY804_02445 [Alphaproteobacteria bacterium]|nr:hypothetical protein [Alphaproteobacteria bacterium]